VTIQIGIQIQIQIQIQASDILDVPDILKAEEIAMMATLD